MSRDAAGVAVQTIVSLPNCTRGEEVPRNLDMLGLILCHIQDRSNGKDPTFHCVCPDERNASRRRGCLDVKSSSLTRQAEFQIDYRCKRPPMTDNQVPRKSANSGDMKHAHDVTHKCQNGGNRSMAGS